MATVAEPPIPDASAPPPASDTAANAVASTPGAEAPSALAPTQVRCERGCCYPAGYATDHAVKIAMREKTSHRCLPGEYWSTRAEDAKAFRIGADLEVKIDVRAPSPKQTHVSATAEVVEDAAIASLSAACPSDAPTAPASALLAPKADATPESPRDSEAACAWSSVQPTPGDDAPSALTQVRCERFNLSRLDVLQSTPPCPANPPTHHTQGAGTAELRVPAATTTSVTNVDESGSDSAHAASAETSLSPAATTADAAIQEAPPTLAPGISNRCTQRGMASADVEAQPPDGKAQPIAADAETPLSEALAHAVATVAEMTARSSADVAAWGCQQLDAIASADAAGQRAAVVAHAPEAIVAALRCYVGRADVVEWGCRALGSIAVFHPAGQQAVVLAGAPSAIAFAVTRPLFAVARGAGGAAASFLQSTTRADAAQLDSTDAALEVVASVDAAGPCDADMDAGVVCVQWACLALSRMGQILPRVPGVAAGSVTAASSGARVDDVLGGSACAATKTDNFLGAVRWRLRAPVIYQTVINADLRTRGEPVPDSDIRFTVCVQSEVEGCLVRDLARSCGLYPLPGNIVIHVASNTCSPSVLAFALAAESSRVDNILALAPSTRQCLVLEETRRLLPYVSIERRWAAEKSPLAASTATATAASSAAFSSSSGRAAPQSAPASHFSPGPGEKLGLWECPAVTSEDVRVVVPPSRYAVTKAVVCILLQRLKCHANVVTVWAADEMDCAMPAPGMLLGVKCPDPHPRVKPRVRIVAADGRRVFVDSFQSDVNPLPINTGISCHLGAYIRHQQHLYMLSTGHGILPRTCEHAYAIRDWDDSSSQSEVCPFVGSVWPLFIDASTPPFRYGNLQAVADISMFKVPETYCSDAAIQTGADFVDAREPNILRPLNLQSVGSEITCSFHNGDSGVYRVCGIGESVAGATVGHTGAAVMHYSYIAEYVNGSRIRQGHSGAPAASPTGNPHSFVRSLVAAVSPTDWDKFLKHDDGRIFDEQCFATGEGGTVERYACFTPAECALAQAMRLLGAYDMRDVAYVAVPVGRPAAASNWRRCTVS